VDDLTTLVHRTLRGDALAYGDLVRRFQDMAVGYAYTLLGDFHLAEDAAQEAFVRAYLDLGRLKEPAAFPGWFRRIVFKYCDRIIRRKQGDWVGLDGVEERVMYRDDPAVFYEQKEMEDRVAFAIQSLPEHQRLVVNLFYMSAFSHREIADFLQVPVQTVKNRLYASRKRLKKELIDMAKEKLQQARPSRNDDFVLHIVDALADFSDRGIQLMLRQVDTKDCALALKGASKDVRDKILSNVSERVRNFIEEMMDDLDDVDKRVVEEAQEKMMAVYRTLVPKPKKLSDTYLKMKKDLKKQLQKTPVSQMDLDTLVDVFGNLAAISSLEGRLSLTEFEGLIRKDDGDDMLGAGLAMMITGQGKDFIGNILEKRKKLLLKQLERRCDMIIEGLVAMNGGQSPQPLRAKLRAHYNLSDEDLS